MFFSHRSRQLLLLVILLAATLFSQDSSSQSIDTSQIVPQSSSSLKTPPPQDTLSQAKFHADSLRRDSLKEVYGNRFLKMVEPIYALPTSILSLYPQDSLTSYRLYRSDYTTWTDLLGALADFTAVRYTPRSHLNRALYRGYLIPLVNAPADKFEALHTPTLHQYTATPQQLIRAQIGPTSLGGALRYPHTQTTTEVTFTWEGGLFGGNLLDLRFSRNISRNLSLAVLMNYQHLKRANYNYGGGTLENLYTKQPKIAGYNPESESRKTNITLRWDKKSTFEVSYTYTDLHHDLVFQDSTPHATGLDTIWKANSDYTSQASAWGLIPLSERFSLFLAGQLDKNAHNLQNFDDAHKIYAGEHRQVGSAAIQFAPIINDSIALTGTFTRHQTRQYGDNTRLIHHNSVLLSNNFSLSQSDLLSIKIDGGFSTVTSGGSQQFFPAITGSSVIKAHKFSFSGWGAYTIAPLTTSYDTLLTIPVDSLGDLYGAGGVSTTFSDSLFRFSLGYSYVTGLQEKTVLSYWVNQTTPYSNPGSVFSSSLAFGEWHGISLYTNWLFSDTRPYVKSQSQLSFHFHKNQRSRHLYIDIINSYWSKRSDDYGTINGVPFGGIAAKGMWNKAIINLDLKTTVEIKSFRLFWKVGNVLHRTQSYMPGYQMPGLNFRWGFSWSIMG